jgi:hypothetical protein
MTFSPSSDISKRQELGDKYFKPAGLNAEYYRWIDMQLIETESVLNRLGVTKNQLRYWIKNGLLIKAAGTPLHLDMSDHFSLVSVCIRTSFILADNSGVNLSAIFNDEFGSSDKKLQVLLASRQPIEIIEDISARHGLQFTLAKIAGLF